jgi:ribosomal protein S18 acetylase RimI-like enzyme
MGVTVREYDHGTDLAWVEPLLAERWGGRLQARRGELIDVLTENGLIAETNGEACGLLFWRPDGDETEIALLWAFEQRRGIGRALVTSCLALVDGSVWLVTTDDNVGAVAFYEALGFEIREVRAGAVDRAREELKPQIPVVNADGVAIHDEIELVLRR